MKQLTVKEEKIMEYFWKKGLLFVKELLEYYEETKRAHCLTGLMK